MGARSLSSGRFSTGLVDAFLAPRIRKARPPVIYCHGLNGTGAQGVGGQGLPAVAALLSALAADGWPVVAPSTGNTWGNDAGLVRVAAAAAWARAHLGATADPAVVVGVSMGGTTALRWAYETPEDCAAAVVILPALDIEWIRANDPEGIDGTASIEAALSLGPSDPVPESADPARFAPDLAMPIQLWTASDDDVSHGAASFAATTGAQHHDLGPLGHSNAAVAAVDHAAVVEFVAAHT